MKVCIIVASCLLYCGVNSLPQSLPALGESIPGIVNGAVNRDWGSMTSSILDTVSNGMAGGGIKSGGSKWGSGSGSESGT